MEYFRHHYCQIKAKVSFGRYVTPEHPNKIEIGCARLHHLDDKIIYLKWMKKAV
jgi:hypothetical protein